jgi:nucleotide-binding universal stress UspA family protein
MQLGRLPTGDLVQQKDVGTMLNTILLPLDGSPLAERARTYAMLLARRSGANIKLMQAVQAYVAPGTDPIEAQVEVTQCAEEFLNAVAERMNAEGIKTESHIYYGEPISSILDAATRQRADMIVMSTHGRGGIARMLYGSVADQILRRSNVPVLMVPSIVEQAWPTDQPLSLLVPLDGSELSEEALTAVTLVKDKDALGVRLTLLRVVQPVQPSLQGQGHPYVPFNEDLEVAAARRYLEHEASKLAARGYLVKTLVSVGEPARVIGDVARELHVDLIAMATHGKSGLSRLVLGSVATAILRHTTAPLLLARPVSMHHTESEESATVATAGRTSTHVTMSPAAGDDPLVAVQVTASDLELIARSLKALGHAPGFDYGHVLAARALADKLAMVRPAEIHEVATFPS